MNRIVFTLAWLSLPGLAAQLWLAPYVQDVSQSRAVVQWVTVGGGGLGEVRVLPDGVAVVSIVETVLPAATHLSVPIFVHRAELKGLSAGKVYRYEVRLDGVNVASGRELSFRTAGDGPMQFLVFGDSGDGGPAQRQLASRMLTEPAQFLLHVGDIAYWEGNFTQFAEVFFLVYPELLSRMAVFPVPGNHDYEFQDALAYRTLFTVPTGSVDVAGRGRYYSFDWGPVHFTVIDSNRSLVEAVASRGSMLSWLEQDLRATRKPWRVALVHHPPFPTSNEKRNDPLCALVAQYVTPILERHGVQLLLAGHEHIYQRTQARRSRQFVSHAAGTVYVTTGGGGSQFYPPGEAPFVAVNASGSHYLRVSVDRQAMVLEAVDASGAVKDTTTLSSAPMLLDPAIVNAASFGKEIGVGSLVSVFGWNLSGWEDSATGEISPLELGGTKASLGGKDLRLIYASRSQLNLQLPYEAATEPRMVVKTSEGEASLLVSAKQAAPALFALRMEGRDVVAALHMDGSLVDAARPAIPGEWLALFATGLGRVTNTPNYGMPAKAAPLSYVEAPVEVMVDGIKTAVQFAGLAPGFWGLNQVNFQVPLVHGWTKVTVMAGGLSSNVLELPVR